MCTTERRMFEELIASWQTPTSSSSSTRDSADCGKEVQYPEDLVGFAHVPDRWRQ